ncbi:MAG: TonB family protein [Proteobacteria bacterium]|nr:TonB family protein [Pseudomonadota bacterium]
MFVIIAFHVVVIFTFASIFNGGTPLREPPVIKGRVLPLTRTADPPLPKPTAPLVETHVAPLDFPNQFVFPPESTTITFTGQPDTHVSGPVADVSRVSGGIGAGFPSAEVFYPASAKRLGEQGVADVRVCVDGSGRLTGIPTVSQSAGSPRLDEGAIRLAQAGSGHYRPATENGRAVSSCFAIRVRFMLQ